MIMYVVFSKVMVMPVEQAYHSRAQKDEKQREGRTSGPREPLCRYQGFSLSPMQAN